MDFNQKKFDYRGWGKRYKKSIKGLLDYMDINRSFISNDIYDKLEEYKGFGADMHSVIINMERASGEAYFKLLNDMDRIRKEIMTAFDVIINSF